ncbi:MAG: hypothetical protein J4G12_08480 [Gemmatimonadetes bacterium]|nr:hypothetical protein [Gemmatimonadota bacterium]
MNVQITPSRLLAPLAALAVLTACASAPEDPNAPRACFTVNNEDGGGPIGNVWIRHESRQRLRIGEVGIGRRVTECFRRTGMIGRWTFVVYSSSSDRMDPARGQNSPPTRVSDSFIYQEDTEFVWDVRTGRITLQAAPPEGND